MGSGCAAPVLDRWLGWQARAPTTVPYPPPRSPSPSRPHASPSTVGHIGKGGLGAGYRLSAILRHREHRFKQAAKLGCVSPLAAHRGVLRRGVTSSVGLLPGIALVTGEARDELIGRPTSLNGRAAMRTGGASRPPPARLVNSAPVHRCVLFFPSHSQKNPTPRATSARRLGGIALRPGTTAKSARPRRQPPEIPPPEPWAGSTRPRPLKGRKNLLEMRPRYPINLAGEGHKASRPPINASCRVDSLIRRPGSCSPPSLTRTQLPSATGCRPHPGKESQLAERAPSDAHAAGQKTSLPLAPSPCPRATSAQ